MNNLAALLSTYASSTLGFFAALSGALRSDASGLAVSSFLSAALVAHIVSESVPSTYVGIPSGDVVSVLPAHRLARSGLGRSAVRASADGAFAGILASVIVLLPMSLLMGEPLQLYEVLRRSMGAIVLFFCVILLVSEGSRAVGGRRRRRLVRLLRGLLVFSGSGVLGFVVLATNFYSCPLPDLPWMPHGFAPRESLLLPMFAGLFGVPSLILSLGSVKVSDLQVSPGCVHIHRPRAKDLVLTLLGGTVVGWIPGMTSGSAATLCMPAMRETAHHDDIPSSLRFIWLYSSISGSGAVFAVGALFTIMRARSGTMDAVEMFLGSGLTNSMWPTNILLMLCLVMAMMVSAMVSLTLLKLLDSKLQGVRNTMGSEGVAIAALVFIASLSLLLTGARGVIVLTTSVVLGLLPPLIGVRRIQLMGCLLVPITASLLMTM
jgi:putative membrane protein